MWRPPTSPLFPYTTLFRSCRGTLKTRSFSGKSANRNERNSVPALRGIRAPRQARPLFSDRISDTARTTFGHNGFQRSEEHTFELQSLAYLVCRLLLEKKKR